MNLGRRRVPMDRLVEVVSDLGYGDAWTFVNSGNVVFDAAGRRGDIEADMENALEAEFGFEVTTFVRTPAEVRRALAAEPFSVEPGDTWFVTFLKAPPGRDVADAMEAASNDYDTLVVRGSEVHWRMRGRSSDTTVKKSTWNLVGPLGSTSRNVTVLSRLMDRIVEK